MSIDLDATRDAYITEFYSSLDVPRSLTCLLLYKYNEHKQLCELEFVPDHYNDLGNARDALAATKFLSKAKFLSTNIDVEAVAIEKFREAETVCKETNERIRSGRFKNPATVSCLLAMTRKISMTLGDFDAEEFVNSANWGPGATTLLKRRDSTYPKKFSVERKITAGAYGFVKPWFHLVYPHWEMMFEIDGNSKIITVDKNAKTDRTIAIEPGINLWFQKGIGLMMKRRLARQGINLKDQTLNQKKSRIGSKYNNLATIDFSMASDTVARALVEDIFPSDWLNILKIFRSNAGLLGKERIIFEKFSSMGNGFTFELESLIFYTCALACCQYMGVEEKDVSVFGDDVIIPACVADLYTSVCADLGFKVNVSKSYASGYYRESCGSHFWNGVDIKPIFLKESFNGQDCLLKSANSVRRFAHSRNNYGCDIRLRPAWQILVDALGPKCPRMSDGYGDCGIIENIEDSDGHYHRAKHGLEGYFVRVWAVKAMQLEMHGLGLLLTKLKSVGSSPILDNKFSFKKGEFVELDDGSSIGNKIPMPGRVRYAQTRVFIPLWADLGKWC